MKKLIFTTLLATLFSLNSLFLPAYAESMPSSLATGGDSLALNGEGVRKKLFLSMYNAGLYLQQKSSDAEAIIAADEAMAIRLEIVSGLISSKKMEHATRAGFDASTGGNTAAIQNQIEQFLEVFRAEISSGDVYLLSYQPGQGVGVSKNGQPSSVIAGMPFKSALFGIWLSANPVQSNLKADMLGQ